MPDSKISNLPSVVTPSTSDVLPIVNGGATKKVTIQNLSDNLPLANVSNSTYTTVRTNSSSWGISPYIVLRINGQTGLTNTNNATDIFVPWNEIQYSSDVSVLSANITNENILIHQPGVYEYSFRYSSYNLESSFTNLLEIKLRGSTDGLITTTTGGSAIALVANGYTSTTVPGWATKVGTDHLIIPTAPYWIAAIFYHTGANGGPFLNQGYPVFDDTFGNRPQLVLRRIRDL